MKTIHKYKLQVVDTQDLSLPIGSKILTIQNQNEVPMLWVLINPKEFEKEIKTIYMFGTGQVFNVDSNIEYISTFQLFSGSLVFHAFLEI